MLENGYILLHRKIVNWEWYKNKNTKILFLHLLATVNYEDKKFEGLVVKRGSRIASISNLGSEIDLSVQEVRTAIKNLKSTGEITSNQQGKYTVYTVLNYDKYQVCQQGEQQGANKATTNEQQGANNNEIKINEYNKANNINKYIYKATEKFESEELTDKIIAISNYRTKVKKPFTEQAVDLFIKKLTDLEPSDINRQIAIVNQTIERGWLTVYPLREEENKNAYNKQTDTDGNSREIEYGTLL